MKDALSEMDSEPEITITDEEKKAIIAQADELSSKVNDISNEVMAVFEKYKLTPFQALMLLKAISDGILKLLESEAEAQMSETNIAS